MHNSVKIFQNLKFLFLPLHESPGCSSDHFYATVSAFFRKKEYIQSFHFKKDIYKQKNTHTFSPWILWLRKRSHGGVEIMTLCSNSKKLAKMFVFMSLYIFFGDSAIDLDSFGHVDFSSQSKCTCAGSLRLPCLPRRKGSCRWRISEATNFFSNGSPVATKKYFILILV